MTTCMICGQRLREQDSSSKRISNNHDPLGGLPKGTANPDVADNFVVPELEGTKPYI